MSITALRSETKALTEPAQFWNAVKQWFTRNGVAAIQSSILGAAFGYGLNFGMSYLVFAGGFDGASGGLALFKSSLFCGIVSTIVFGLLGYRRAVGKERFWQTIRHAPKHIAMLVQRDGAAARVHLLWGAALSFVATQFISPWLGTAVALGFLFAVPSVVGRVLAAMLSRLWSSLVQSVAPTKGRRLEGSLGMLVGIQVRHLDPGPARRQILS